MKQVDEASCAELGIMGGGMPSSRGSARRLGCRPAATSSTARANGWMSSSARTRGPWMSGCTLQTQEGEGEAGEADCGEVRSAARGRGASMQMG